MERLVVERNERIEDDVTERGKREDSQIEILDTECDRVGPR